MGTVSHTGIVSVMMLPRHHDDHRDLMLALKTKKRNNRP
jgi:hypothetical protein